RGGAARQPARHVAGADRRRAVRRPGDGEEVPVPARPQEGHRERRAASRRGQVRRRDRRDPGRDVRRRDRQEARREGAERPAVQARAADGAVTGMTTTHRGEPSAAGTPAADAPRARRGRRAGRDGAGGDAQGTRRLAALLLSPTLLVLALVIGYPVLAGFRESLYARGEGLDAEGFVVEGERFVGLGNYTAIFQGDRAEAFWNAFGNTTFFTVTTVALETVIGV